MHWEGGANSDPRYHQMEGQLTITNVDRNRDQGSWTCSVVTPGGEQAKREVKSTKILIFMKICRGVVHSMKNDVSYF